MGGEVDVEGVGGTWRCERAEVAVGVGIDFIWGNGMRGFDLVGSAGVQGSEPRLGGA